MTSKGAMQKKKGNRRQIQAKDGPLRLHKVPKLMPYAFRFQSSKGYCIPYLSTPRLTTKIEVYESALSSIGEDEMVRF